MKSPNYKVGWLVKNQLAALTHFHSNITQEDIQGVLKETQDLIKNITEPFSIIIDNRLAPINQIYSLTQLQSSSPVLSHPQLEYLIIIKPNHLTLTEKHKHIEIAKGVKLVNTSSINTSTDFLLEKNKTLSLKSINLDLFPN
ncbi:MAG: hypothetical protein COA58_11390 [Bacteroidetes bacterium]|nr:MAG: hypothetical protein COA58_11390 [Bacteroidota bacterium]